ncbi:hypothetical protein SAMN05443663_101353 [Flavobacterium defluvii]|uniref:Uncharacterized protein n=1 Tax=Flavobacterium defluvii TaxID=370979 RepID=A0A1M5F5A0_9FLAO|nr:hypothetical protein SAMN05443663_101353 [Flavobacterium defluvii]
MKSVLITILVKITKLIKKISTLRHYNTFGYKIVKTKFLRKKKITNY